MSYMYMCMSCVPFLKRVRIDITWCAVFACAGERKLSFQFTVHTESSWNKRSNWVMAAQSEREMKDWINAFKVASWRLAVRLLGCELAMLTQVGRTLCM